MESELIRSSHRTKVCILWELKYYFATVCALGRGPSPRCDVGYILAQDTSFARSRSAVSGREMRRLLALCAVALAACSEHPTGAVPIRLNSAELHLDTLKTSTARVDGRALPDRVADL